MAARPRHVYCQEQVSLTRWCDKKAVMSPPDDPTKSYCADHAPRENADA